MLIEFTCKLGGRCWVNPQYVMYVLEGPDPNIIMHGDRTLGLAGDGADVARQINKALAAETDASSVAGLTRPSASGCDPLPWLRQITCKHCGKQYGESRQVVIFCGATPRCPHCGKYQGSSWDVGNVSG